MEGLKTDTGAKGMRNSLAFEYLLTPEGIVASQRLVFDQAGVIQAIEPVTEKTRYDGFFGLPGLPNAHSHAFQRAMTGFGEVAEPGGRKEDSFWSWREAMYRLAGRVSPEQLHSIARQAFGEMLAAGFTSVGEFHYLHHLPDGTTSPEMARAVIEAASEVGIRLVMLPVCYLTGGFGAQLQPEQRRFAYASLEEFLESLEFYRDVPCGVAPHSLRAVPPDRLDDLVDAATGVLGADSPIHIHISEQRLEVEECKQRFGKRPVQLLFDSVEVNHRWNLVHATHAEDSELAQIVASNARVVVCPLTEAYLGDGVFPATRFTRLGGAIAIGSDSNVRIDAIEELRLLEYTQRLRDERRGRLTTELGLGEPLWKMAAQAGARALALPVGELTKGHYADIVVLDSTEPPLVGPEPARILDALIIGGSARNVADVYVGGTKRVDRGSLVADGDPKRFAEAVRSLMT